MDFFRKVSSAKLWTQNLVIFLIIKYMLLSNILQWNTTHENGLKENSTSKMLALQLISKIVYRPILDVHVKALYVCTFDYTLFLNDQFTYFLFDTVCLWKVTTLSMASGRFQRDDLEIPYSPSSYIKRIIFNGLVTYHTGLRA